MQSATRDPSLLQFIDACPTPFHAGAAVARRLGDAGFTQLAEGEAFTHGAGRFFVVRGGSIVAWIASGRAPEEVGFRVLGAHTDSPNLRVKARPNTGAAGFRQLGVEVYGGVLLNSWLDRDLGLSGRVMVRDGDGASARLVKLDRPLLRIPQLAIHLDREVNTRGLVLDPQLHMAPVWGLGRSDERGLQRLLGAELGVDERGVLGYDLMLHDLAPSTFLGLEREFICAPRLDNLCSCWCAVQALLARAAAGRDDGPLSVVALFDHEEVGSSSNRGAASPLLKDVLERVVLAHHEHRGGAREEFHRAVARSLCASIDMAHATHPNYREKHEPEHWIALNAGPVIKLNTNMRYATDSEGEAAFALACERALVPFQKYFHRSNLACGSTIGPITAAVVGMRTVDVGNPQLSMHSIREMCGADDPASMVRALVAFLE
jgi:aspartyl aminopeptidase